MLKSGRGIFLVFGVALLLVACVEDDPRYPVYYRYAVDVKVDGRPLRIERVIKCTGTLVKGSTYAPGVTTGSTFVSPPLMGAYVPGSSQAVYAPVVGACRWASATPEEREEDSKKINRVLDQPFSEVNEYLPPNARLPVLWVSDDQTFDEMEYYVSARVLSGIDSHVEFIRAYPPEIVDEADFKASEERARTESPDLTPFFLPEDRRQAIETQIYKERFKEEYMGRVFPICYAAWCIPRLEWSLVPGLEDWVAGLPDDGRAYRIEGKDWGTFEQLIQVANNPRLTIVADEPPAPDKSPRRFNSYDWIFPVIQSESGTYIDFDRQGLFGCSYNMIWPDRSEANQRFRIDHATEPSPSYLIEPASDRLYARFVPEGAPVYVRELDEFIVFISLSTGGRTTGEPVVKGWKE